MASSSKDQTQHGLPAHGGHPSDTTGSVYNLVADRRSSIPIPPSNSGNQPQLAPGTAPPNPSKPNPPNQQPPPNGGHSIQHRFLTPTEWARVAHGLGAIRDGGEEHQVVHPTSWLWAPKGLPDGLYRDVVFQRAKYALGFQLLSTLHWFLMVVQVMIGAVLTALGSLPQREATLITTLAAVNTMGAGLIALMHNSGLPDRYRMDKAQFVQVEDFIREILDTGIVEAQQKVEDILNECFVRFATARATVISNKPEVYTSPAATGGKNSAVLCRGPSVHL